jgi:hypothetical protein
MLGLAIAGFYYVYRAYTEKEPSAPTQPTSNEIKVENNPHFEFKPISVFAPVVNGGSRDGVHADTFLSLLKERQRLEKERQPLMEIEEAGIKVIPRLQIGKSESDYRREELARIARDISRIDREIVKLDDPSVIGPVVQFGAFEWKDLAADFRRINNDSVRADWSRTGDGSEAWRVCGGGNHQDCESLCKLAGAMLAKSKKIFALLPENRRLQSDSLYIWLDFLKDSGNMNRTGHGVEIGQQK